MYRTKAAYNDGMASRLQAAVTRLRKFEEAGPPTGDPARPERHDAAARRPYGQARRRLRAARADRADEALRPRGLVRRAGRRARLERLGQVPPAAAAGGRGQRPRRRAPTGRRRTDRPRRPPGRRAARRARAPGLVRADPRAPRARRPHAARRPVARRRPPRRHGPRAGEPGARPLRARRAAPSRTSSRCPAGSRRGSRSCCSSCPARRCCCSTSRPTTSTWPAPRRSRRGSRASRARCSPSPTTGGSPRSFDRYLVLGADGGVYESVDPVWDEGRVVRAR